MEKYRKSFNESKLGKLHSNESICLAVSHFSISFTSALYKRWGMGKLFDLPVEKHVEENTPPQ